MSNNRRISELSSSPSLQTGDFLLVARPGDNSYKISFENLEASFTGFLKTVPAVTGDEVGTVATIVGGNIESTSPSTGSLVVKGGAGISKRLNVSGDARIYSNTQSLSYLDGALTVDGGIGVAKNLNVGGDLDVSGTSLFHGTLGASGDAIIGGVATFKNDIDLSNQDLLNCKNIHVEDYIYVAGTPYRVVDETTAIAYGLILGV